MRSRWRLDVARATFGAFQTMPGVEQQADVGRAGLVERVPAASLERGDHRPVVSDSPPTIGSRPMRTPAPAASRRSCAGLRRPCRGRHPAAGEAEHAFGLEAAPAAGRRSDRVDAPADRRALHQRQRQDRRNRGTADARPSPLSSSARALRRRRRASSPRCRSRRRRRRCTRARRRRTLDVRVVICEIEKSGRMQRILCLRAAHGRRACRSPAAEAGPRPRARADVTEVAHGCRVARLLGKRPPEEVLVERERAGVRVTALEVDVRGLQVGGREHDALARVDDSRFGMCRASRAWIRSA